MRMVNIFKINNYFLKIAKTILKNWTNKKIIY